MDFIKRIGTQRHKFKLEFVMLKLKFSRHLPGKIYVSIRRGDHKMKTENLVEMGSNNECDLKKEIITFPSITLFYDESDQKYQEKPGDMKILLLKDTGEKKLLGTVPFDVAEFANAKRATGLSSSRTEQKVKIKRQLEEIPEKLRMEATIQFNAYTKYLGEASQTDKSIKDEKVRSKSPFEKLKSFFLGDENEEPKPKQPSSLQAIRKPDLKQSTKKSRQRSRQKELKQMEKDFQFQEEETPKKPPKRQRISSDYNVAKPSDKQKGRRKINQQPKQPRRQKNISEEEQQSNQYVEPVRQKKNSRNRNFSPEEHQSSNIQEQKLKDSKQKQSNIATSKKSQSSKNLEVERPNKNVVQQKPRDLLTQYEEKSGMESNFNKSQPVSNPTHNQKNNQFFFDDPTSFPANYQPSYKKSKKDIQDQASPQPRKKPNNSKNQDKQRKTKTDQQIKKVKSESQEDQFQNWTQQPSKNSASLASPQRKIKQNSIQISSKQLQKELQKKRKSEKSNKQTNEIPFIPKDNKPPKNKQPKEGKIVEPTSKKESQPPKEQKLSSSEIKNIFISTNQPPERAEQKFAINPKKVSQNESSIFTRQELDRKNKDLAEMKVRIMGLEGVQKKLKEEQALRQAAEKSLNLLKEQNKRLEKDLERIKQQNNNLRSENESHSSIFRVTQDHFLNNTQQNNLEEENKRLQRQKNEMIVSMTKEKQRHAKQIKLLKEELEKQRMKYKQLENVSKIDLKKLKDQNLKLSGNVEIMKDKNKQKIRQNETLISQNKALNTEVIGLKDKLGALKIKICEKLNEANEHGQSQLMEVLTQLCEDM